MKRTLIAAALLSLVCAVSAFASEGGQPQTSSSETFDQRQARVLKMIDDHIAGLQDARACVQAAKNDDDLKACREKETSKMKKNN